MYALAGCFDVNYLISNIDREVRFAQAVHLSTTICHPPLPPSHPGCLDVKACAADGMLQCGAAIVWDMGVAGPSSPSMCLAVYFLRLALAAGACGHDLGVWHRQGHVQPLVQKQGPQPVPVSTPQAPSRSSQRHHVRVSVRLTKQPHMLGPNVLMLGPLKIRGRHR